MRGPAPPPQEGSLKRPLTLAAHPLDILRRKLLTWWNCYSFFVTYAKADGWTALMYACEHGHEVCVRSLLEAAAEVDKTEEDGWTALMLAAQNGHDLCARSLLEAGADMDKQNIYMCISTKTTN